MYRPQHTSVDPALNLFFTRLAPFKQVTFHVVTHRD
jgi:hypothetical protein